MIRCAITDIGLNNDVSPKLFAAARARLLEHARRWAIDGVELVQLREKQLQSQPLVELAERLQDVLRGSPARLLINGRLDVAVAVEAAGAHLGARSGELTPDQVRSLFRMRGLPRAVVSVSCHTLGEVQAAQAAGADYILFGPVFEKRVGDQVVVRGVGAAGLRAAVDAAQGRAVLALGGVTEANMAECLATGAAGVAGIRLFAA